ncbi:MAG: type-F conjugative transfer system secretin TraK [Alphaproteobacteria bacterium]|nr:type-F conjugative transfer system secretin TraK [Alphaproteobacteria bacterium]MBP9776761.1 type-F conjugative transfer system secretin TraK [Alphaproteobacteria bacterium]
MISRFLMFLLAGTAANAAIIRPLDEMKVLEVPVSQDGLTRIKVQDDRILHVFGNAGEYVLETDEYQGQIFIRPTLLEMENIKSSKSISLTLTTEAGHTQDLRLIPKNQAPEALIFKSNTDIAQEIKKERQASAPLFLEEVEELIHACRIGRIPLGYKEIPLNLSTLQEPHLLVREIQGQKLRGLTYRIQNNSQNLLVLSEPKLAESFSFKENTLIALLISKRALTPGEGTDIYVVARAN